MTRGRWVGWVASGLQHNVYLSKLSAFAFCLFGALVVCFAFICNNATPIVAQSDQLNKTLRLQKGTLGRAASGLQRDVYLRKSSAFAAKPEHSPQPASQITTGVGGQ